MPALKLATPIEGADAHLTNRWVHLFAGACLACVGLAFFFLDRHYGDFGVVALPWLVATLIGFGTGAIALHSTGPLGRVMCALLGVIAAILAVFPTFLIYAQLRWLALCMLFVSIARAPLLRTRRDLYFTLMTCFVAAAVIAVHSRADWLLWVYLGPACLFAGLALTMDHVAGHAIGALIKLTASGLFMAVVIVLAGLLFLWLPRPPTMGFGFLPPPVERGLVKLPAGTQGQGSTGGAPGTVPTASPGLGDGDSQPWHDMVGRMRRDLQDTTVPEWQRSLLGGVLDALEGALAREPGSQRADQSQAMKLPTTNSGSLAVLDRVVLKIRLATLLAWLLALALLALCGWRRHQIAFAVLNAVAWSLTALHPLASMKVSARMMAVGLRRLGSRRRPAQTLREQVARVPDLAVMERFRFDEAIDLYYGVRFGRLVATAAHARTMRVTVLGATDVAFAASGRLPSQAAPRAGLQPARGQ